MAKHSIFNKKNAEPFELSMAFLKNGFDVSDEGFFLYVNGIKGDNNFYYDHDGYQDIGFMEFKTTLIPYTGALIGSKRSF